ncbi:MAG: DUF4091 domain-containing protein [Peptostreptococcaceae bacterium]|jgi:hypothetical protein|nr:DUF4091 domain-containing protein [Peptostreptococcaceae bacterium]
MEFKSGIIDSSFRHKKYSILEDKYFEKDYFRLKLCKNSKAGFQIINQSNEEFLLLVDRFNEISYKGLINRVRIDVKSDIGSIKPNVRLLGYTKTDSNEIVADPIINDLSVIVKKDIAQMVYVDFEIPKDISEEKLRLKIDFYHTKGYEDEEIIKSMDVIVDIKDYVLEDLNKSDFFLDLWQHPTSWARMYNVRLFSDDHFTIIDNYLKELASLGQKVVTIIASDYSWAGQDCYNVSDNASNLFELNMIKVYKDENNKLICDFSNIDRYIKIAFKYGIDKEIDLFGILCNWDRRGFKTPIKDYEDPIRINYYDKNDDKFKYIDSKELLKEYIEQVLKYFKDNNYQDKLRIMTDEPNDILQFKKWSEFLDSLCDYKLRYKSAIHDQDFMDNLDDKITDISFNACLSVKANSKIEEYKNLINKKNGILTWFVCCFPKRPNNFISSPPLESRLIGWFSYYFGFDGFLRWDYAIWPTNPFENPSYKFPRWKAGDMFFVYPGKNLKPVSSLRLENLRYGIQDYLILKKLQDDIGKENLYQKLEELLSKKQSMTYDMKNSDVNIDYSLDYDEYMDIIS